MLLSLFSNRLHYVYERHLTIEVLTPWSFCLPPPTQNTSFSWQNHAGCQLDIMIKPSERSKLHRRAVGKQSCISKKAMTSTRLSVCWETENWTGPALEEDNDFIEAEQLEVITHEVRSHFKNAVIAIQEMLKELSSSFSVQAPLVLKEKSTL